MPRMQGSFEQRGTEVQLCKAPLAMQEQVEQRLMSGSRVVKYALAAFRYLVTGSVAILLALLLALLIVELGAVIGAALEHDMLASRNCGGSVMWTLLPHGGRSLANEKWRRNETRCMNHDQVLR